MSIGGGIFLLVLGAILSFAVGDQQVGSVDLSVIGIILMIAGAVLTLLSLFVLMPRRRQTRAVTSTTPDGAGGYTHETRRDDVV